MNLRPTIIQTMTQKLVMTPRLQQAIKILQMPRLELVQYISQQLMENPLLEESYEELEETGDDDPESEGEVDEMTGDLTEEDIDLETGLPETEAPAETDSPELDVTDDNFGDVNWEQYFDDSPAPRNEWEAPADDDRREIASPPESLEEHLLWQLRMSVTSEEDYTIGEAIIGNLNDDGYLTVSIEEIAELLECKVEDVERLLKVIQTFDPVGVGARDLAECLLVQLEQLDLRDTIAGEIVENGYLQDLEANRFPQVARKLGVELDLVRAAANAIAALEPKPGRQFSPLKTEYVTPDVTVEEIDGEYKVFMNDYGPSLRVNPTYKNILSSRDPLSAEAQDYIKSQLQSADWVMESIEHRRKTILRVTESIFDIQKEFLDRGPASLKPLTRREIAERLGISESTVSRATGSRYVQTPRGVFPLGYFFTSGISTKNGEMASSESIREMIKDMINEEDPKNPLSDKDIETRLNKKGFEIKRRTIAKYREELNILNSSKRKQW